MLFDLSEVYLGCGIVEQQIAPSLRRTYFFLRAIRTRREVDVYLFLVSTLLVP